MIVHHTGLLANMRERDTVLMIVFAQYYVVIFLYFGVYGMFN